VERKKRIEDIFLKYCKKRTKVTSLKPVFFITHKLKNTYHNSNNRLQMLKITTGKKIIVGLTLFLPSFIKLLVYRALGATIGKNMHIGLGSYIFAEKITLGQGASIGNSVHIVCKEIVVDEDAIIASEVVIGGESGCHIGKRCYIGQRAHINVAEQVVLEDDVGLGGDIYTHGVWPPYTEGYPRKFAPVLIKRGAWIPPNTTILPGVTIGEEAMIGTGAVVTKSIPRRAFAIGVPARVVKSVDAIQVKLTSTQKEARIKEILDDFRRWIGDNMPTEGNVEVGDFEFALVATKKSLLKTKRWALYYTSENVTPELVQRLFSLKNTFTRMTILALRGIDFESLKRLSQDLMIYEFFDFVELENLSYKSNRNDFFHLLHGFLRSYYGVRLKSKSSRTPEKGTQ